MFVKTEASNAFKEPQDMVERNLSDPFAPLKDEKITLVMIGNPGVGKSTLLNGLKVIFKSGISLGTGLTSTLQMYRDDAGNTYLDTPGLSDEKKRKAAAAEIEKALKKGGVYKHVFWVYIGPSQTAKSSFIRDDSNDFKGITTMIGNPGSGKSTILNGLIGKRRLSSGVSITESLTQAKQESLNDRILYWDCPGLSDFEESQKSFRTADSEPKVLILGNSGVGKSTILNCLIGKEVFRTGISFKKSVTEVTQESVNDGFRLIDTPGLNDVRNRAEAAEEITKALMIGGLYKIFFVITLESGRFSAIDKKALNEVLEAFSIRDNAYSIVVNKVGQPILNQIADDYENFMALLHEGPSSKTERVFCLPYDLNIAENYSLPHLKEQFSDFIRGAPMTEIIQDSVKDQDMGEIDDAATRREKADFENGFYLSDPLLSDPLVSALKAQIRESEKKAEQVKLEATLKDLDRDHEIHVKYLVWHEKAIRTSATWKDSNGKKKKHSDGIVGQKKYLAENRKKYKEILNRLASL